MICIAIIAFFCTLTPYAVKHLQDAGPVQSIGKIEIADACDATGIVCLKNVILISGEINSETQNTLKKLARDNPDMRTNFICFNSGGGNIKVAFEMAEGITKSSVGTCLAEKYIIKSKNNITIINTICHSACNYLLLASSRRIAVGNKFKFATHSAGIDISFCFCDLSLTSSSIHKFRFNSIVDRDGNPDRKKHLAFIELGATTPFSDAHYLTFGELLDYAIFTEHLN